MNVLFWFGILLVIIALGILLYLAHQARKMNNFKEEEQQKIAQRLIVLNYFGLGFGVLGLAIVFISLMFNS